MDARVVAVLVSLSLKIRDASNRKIPRRILVCKKWMLVNTDVEFLNATSAFQLPDCPEFKKSIPVAVGTGAVSRVLWKVAMRTQCTCLHLFFDVEGTCQCDQTRHSNGICKTLSRHEAMSFMVYLAQTAGEAIAFSGDGTWRDFLTVCETDDR